MSEQFGCALDGVLASLSGSVVAEVPRPREVKARNHSGIVEWD
jgi:hypothetical protein